MPAGYEVVAVRVWDSPGSVPRFDAPEDFAPFKLAEGLFYTAGKRLHRQQGGRNGSPVLTVDC